MSNQAIIMLEEGSSGPMVDVLEFAEIRGVDPRTVREWLRKGMIPEARKDSSGKWHIPPDARKLDKAPPTSSGEVALIESDGFPKRAEILLDVDEDDPRPRPRAFYTVPEAAKLLGISPYQIRENRDTFGLVPWGPNGLLLVPAPIIREYLGL